MYSEAQMTFDYQSAIKKLLIIGIVLFITAIIICSINKPKNNINYFEDNLNTMTSVATNYYKQNNNVNTITLKEMIDNKMILEFVDEKGNSCDLNNSYAKMDNDKVEVFLKCNSNQDTKITNLI